MSDYEFGNAKQWEEPGGNAPAVRRQKKPPKKKNNHKKKSVAGSVAGSATGPAPGPATPGPAAPGPAAAGSVAGSVRGSRAASPARSVNSRSGGVRPVSRAQSTKSGGQFPSSSSDQAPSEYEPSPWADEPRYHEQYNSDFQNQFFDDYEQDRRDSDEVYGLSAFIAPNFYYNDDPSLDIEAYEGPDGLRRENDGVKLERSGYPPTAYFAISSRRNQTFDERFFGPGGVNLRHIASKTNTYIDIPEDPEDPKLPVWGRPDQVSTAIRDLMLLAEHIQRELDKRKRRVGGKWEKIKGAISDRKQKFIDQQNRERAKRRKLRRPPPKNTFEFDAVGVFLWPKETNPQDYLGVSLELVDDIKYDCNVYIVDFRRSEGRMFQVLGDDKGSVDKAIERLYGTYCESAARNRKGVVKYLVHPPSVDIQNVSVDLVKERELANRQTVHGRQITTEARAILVGEYPSEAFIEYWKWRREELEQANHSYLRRVVEQGLKDVHYYRGHVSLKIHFGTLVLFGYKVLPPNELFSIEEFCEMVRDPIEMTSGEVIRHIGEKHVAEALISECLARKDLFHHIESGYSQFAEDPYNNVSDERDEYTIPSLSTPEPTIEATIECTIYDAKRQAHLVRLEIEFEYIPGRHPGDMANESGDVYKAGMRRWLYIRNNVSTTRGPPKPRRKGPVDVRVLDLESDLAWQLELNTYPFCNEANEYAIFSEFVKRIRIEDIPDESDPIGPPLSGRADHRKRVQRVSYVNLPGMTVDKIIQKTKHKYWITKTSYMFEITRYECFFTEDVNNLYPEGIRISWKGLETNHDIRWGASLTNVEWNSNLLKQSSVKIGCSGEWEPEIDHFFQSSGVGGFNHPIWARDGSPFDTPDPWKGDGWKELMTRADEITKLIAGVKSANLAFAEPGHAGPEEFDE